MVHLCLDPLEEHSQGGWEFPPSDQKLWYNGIGRRGFANKGGASKLGTQVSTRTVKDAITLMRQGARREKDAVITQHQGWKADIFSVGTYHHLEVLQIASTPGEANGTIRTWLNGIQWQSATNVQNQGLNDWDTGFTEFSWAPIWGGKCSPANPNGNNCPKTRDDYMRVGHLYISGVPQ